MKNLLISKSFSYEIVDFMLLRQSNTYHLGGVCSIQLSYEDSNNMKFMKRAFLPPRTLMTGILGGGRSIHLSYGNVYKIVCDLRFLLLQKVSVVGSLRRRSLYPIEERRSIIKNHYTNNSFTKLLIRIIP